MAELKSIDSKFISWEIAISYNEIEPQGPAELHRHDFHELVINQEIQKQSGINSYRLPVGIQDSQGIVIAEQKAFPR